MTLLLVIAYVLFGYYHGGCIQTKIYKWEPTESEKKEIIEKAAEKMAESHEKDQK